MRIKHHTLQELIEVFKYKDLYLTPGAKYSYSNSGYILLGYIIKKASGISYKEYVDQNIFNSLNMKDSGYSNDNKLRINRAYDYDYHEAGLENCTIIDMSVPHAAVEDLFIWNNYSLKIHEENNNFLIKLFNKHIEKDTSGFYGYRLSISDFSIEDNCIEHSY